MVSFLDALGQTANFLNNDPSFQREEMYYRGIDPRIVEPQIERMVAGQQERQAAEAEMQRKQSLAQQIMERGAELTPQEIMAIGAQDAELGKLAANVFLDGQKQQTMQPVTLPNGTVLGYDKYSNTVTPAGRAGQPASMGGSENWQTGYEQPVDEMNGASPMGEWEAEKARIKANAPLTRQQIIENERQDSLLELQTNKAKTEQQDLQKQKTKALDDVEYSLQLMDMAMNHKGLSDAVGVKGASQLFGLLDKPIAGSNAAGFLEINDQIKSRAFLQAYETLRGERGITDKEGETATKAITRLSTATDEKEYIKAATELKNILNIGKQRLLNKNSSSSTDNTQAQMSDPLGIR
jgi:hypothetical protein